ncbi:MAG: Hpt domain-containing protein [Deltaproteobacteria bacterium]|nr:Hpt domain-containing protein [Deltaproteobacteria bacterium]
MRERTSEEVAADQSLLSEFVQESLESLDAVEALVRDLETNASADSVNRIFRTMHSLKGNAAFFN